MVERCAEGKEQHGKDEEDDLGYCGVPDGFVHRRAAVGVLHHGGLYCGRVCRLLLKATAGCKGRRVD